MIMTKTIIKTLSVIFILFILIVFYLSFFGIKTKKFNDQIINSISKINKKINLNLNEVNFLLNPYNFTINIKTKNPQILLGNNKFNIRDIKTNISLKSLINDQFSIDDLNITTKENKLSDVILLARSFKNTPQIFILEKIINDGFISANIKLNFDEKGGILDNYAIKGLVKKGKINFLNKFELQNFNFEFDIGKNNYLITKIDGEYNKIKIKSPKIKVEKKKGSFFVNGKILNDNKNFNIENLQPYLKNLFQNIDIKKIEFSSTNNFSFNISKKFKFKDLKVETIVNLSELIFSGKNLNLKSYFPNLVDKIKIRNHKILIDYNKKKFNISGNGNILIENKSDDLSYQITKNNENLTFDTKINLRNNPLILGFLDYEKKEGRSSLISIKGNLKNNNIINFNLISLNEKNNQFLIKDLSLDKNFKIINFKTFNINYRNKKNILNKLKLKKNKSEIIVEGENLDASKIIDNIMDSEKNNSSFFHSLNSKINIKIKKTYIDDINYINNLSGNINFSDNKINYLKLQSTFPNQKKINLSINTNDNLEIITKLSSGYPKPLIKRYDFIKGFEEGYLNFYSTKKDGISNSLLLIDNFKVKKVPVLAKLLSLASLQGIADLLTGEGVRFTNFEMNFSNQKDLTTIKEMYAIGPAVSILMDGYIQTDKLISLRGTLVPATTINKSIASIPLLGKILIGEKTGEGVFGVSFKIKGPSKNLKTSVNPIKTLTPRFITRTLDKLKMN